MKHSKNGHYLAGHRLPAEKISPIAAARIYFNLIEKDGAYWLNGQPRKLDYIMRETNRLRLRDKLPQVDFNPAWRVPEILPFPMAISPEYAAPPAHG